MDPNHPDITDLEALLQGDFPPGSRERNASIVRHLLSGCSVCQGQMQRLTREQRRLEALCRPGSSHEDHRDLPDVSAPSPYEQAFAKAERTLQAFLDRDRPVDRPPEVLLAKLFPLSLEGGTAALDEHSQSIPQLVKWLIGRSHALRYKDTEEMLHLARMAHIAVESCSAAMVGSEQKLADLRGQAWGHFGNSLRVCGRLREAEQAMDVARHHFAAGTNDLALKARYFEQRGSLCTYQRRFEQALELLDDAEQIYRALGERTLRAGTLILKANALLYSGSPEKALVFLNRAVVLAGPEEDPYLLLAARHNLARCYVDLGRHEEALSLYLRVKELKEEFKDPLIQLRIAWQEGQLLRELGYLRAAEAALLQARKGFMEQGLAYEVAVVSLDLGQVYLKLQLPDEVRQIVSETVPIFRSLRIGRDALIALLQLRKAVNRSE